MTRDKMIRWVGMIVAGVVFLISYSLGVKSRTGTQIHLSERLTTTHGRLEACGRDKESLKSGHKRTIDSEIRMARDEQEKFKEENEMLKQDNSALREENYALEETIDELRDALHVQDFVMDSDVEPLAELQELGNNSDQLKSLLEEAEAENKVTKDDLLHRMIDEIKLKRLGSSQCRDRLQAVADGLKATSGLDHSDLVSDIFGEWDEYLRYKGSKDKLMGGGTVGLQGSLRRAHQSANNFLHDDPHKQRRGQEGDATEENADFELNTEPVGDEKDTDNNFAKMEEDLEKLEDN